jgi:hypothetical protein
MPGHDHIDAMLARMQPVNLDALALLCSPQEEEFLRRKLSPANYRRAARKRARLVWRYAAIVRSNTRVLREICEVVAVDQAGEQAHYRSLVETAVQLRLSVLKLQAQAMLQWMWPGSVAAIRPVMDAYQRLSGELQHLGKPATEVASRGA